MNHPPPKEVEGEDGHAFDVLIKVTENAAVGDAVAVVQEAIAQVGRWPGTDAYIVDTAE